MKIRIVCQDCKTEMPAKDSEYQGCTDEITIYVEPCPKGCSIDLLEN